MTLTHISLFSGIGGDTLAGEWAGFRTVLMCEIDPFCRRVLSKNFPGVPIIEDVRNVNLTTYTHNWRQQGNLREALSGRKNTEAPYPELGSRDSRGEILSGTDSRTSLTLLTAGVPCQPASTAGKRRGKADDRWLWPEAIRVLSELQPTWFSAETPAGIGSLGELGGLSEVGADEHQAISDTEAVELSNICRDIEAHGYEVQPVCIPACAVGAPHRRDRIFIIAHAHNSGSGTPGGGDNGNGQAAITDGANKPLNGIGRHFNKADTDTSEQGLQGSEPGQPLRLPRQSDRSGCNEKPDWTENWASVASRLCTVAPGLSEDVARPMRNEQRVQKLKALGNAIVPMQIYWILKAIADIEANR